MAFSFKEIKFKFLGLIPLFLLFFISLNGNSVIDFKFFSVNIHYIIVYYWILKRPRTLGYGYIFLSGIETYSANPPCLSIGRFIPKIILFKHTCSLSFLQYPHEPQVIKGLRTTFFPISFP